MSIKLYTKMDARYKGYPSWQYFISRPFRHGRTNYPTRYESMQIFFQWRRWCWQTWGPSKELADWLEDTVPRPNVTPEDHNQHWAWVSDSTNTRIYLRGDAELTMFLLRWS